MLRFLIFFSFSLAATPPAKDLLKENEAIIDPYYMHQLLEYGIKLASEGGLDARSLLKDAEVRKVIGNFLNITLTILFRSALCKNSKQSRRRAYHFIFVCRLTHLDS